VVEKKKPESLLVMAAVKRMKPGGLNTVHTCRPGPGLSRQLTSFL
jgi:hypothetical protein